MLETDRKKSALHWNWIKKENETKHRKTQKKNTQTCICTHTLADTKFTHEIED